MSNYESYENDPAWEAMYGSEQETESQKTMVGGVDIVGLMKFLMVVFAYAWWAIIVLYFGLLDDSVGFWTRVYSVSITVAGLALARNFQLAMRLNRPIFGILYFCGLLVAGFLA